MRRKHYEQDDATFAADAYRVAGWHQGIAWRVLGWETQPTDETEWSGFEERTGRVVVVMVGDDAHHTCDQADLSELGELDYCAECGQIGCTHDGRDRSEPDDAGPDEVEPVLTMRNFR